MFYDLSGQSVYLEICPINFLREMKSYLQLLRLHHWIKNTLIFIPAFFGISSLYISLLPRVLFGFFSFSVLSSIVYIFNDIRDIEKDRLHSTKCRRPLASGKIPVSRAVMVLLILSAILIFLLSVLGIPGNIPYNFKLAGLLLLYLVSNIGYSWGLKNIPLVDITILASGYVIRVLFGALLVNIDISVWLYLVVTMGAYYLGLGKRRNEISANEGESRSVLRFYSHDFLDRNMYVCQALCLVFYALWSVDPVTVKKFGTSGFVFTIPLVFIILLKYSLNIETESDGDPTSVLLHDRVLLALCAVYIICAFCILYFNRAAA